MLRARRAYYGALSYVDHQLGQLVEVLRQTGLDKTTAIIFTSDHGEMLGEHGQWYKMSFREGAARIPLLMAFPDGASQQVAQAVCLADVGETLCGLAGAPSAPQVTGRDLMPLLKGETGWTDEVYGEYLGEGTFAPTVMIRRGKWKFLYTPDDPDQLYNLEDDPDEKRNLASLPLYQADVKAFQTEVLQKWNFELLRQKVVLSQQRRALVKRALATGRCTAWDYQPPANAHRAYIRHHKPLEQLEAEARLLPQDVGSL